MRTLDKNKSTLWYVKETGTTDVVDDDGFKTGEKTSGYSTPSKIRIQLYPANGRVSEEIFGTDVSLDAIGVSDLELDDTCLFFLDEPILNEYDNPTYKIQNISKSLNSNNYGFRRL